MTKQDNFIDEWKVYENIYVPQTNYHYLVKKS